MNNTTHKVNDMSMTTEEFIAHFCGPDRNERETLEKTGAVNWREIKAKMDELVKWNDISDAQFVDTELAAIRFWDKAIS